MLLGAIISAAPLFSQCSMEVNVITNPDPPFNLCPGETISLTAIPTGGTAPFQYLWADGQTTQTIIVTPPAFGGIDVWVVDANGCEAWGHVHVKAYVWTVDIAYDPTLHPCEGDPLTLVTTPFFPVGTDYIWSTGQTTSEIVVYGSGEYSVTVTDPSNSCTAAATVQVNYDGGVAPQISAPPALCPGNSATISVINSSDYNSFTWSTGAHTSSISVNIPGTYSVTATQPGGCESVGSVTIAAGMSLSGSTVPNTSCNSPNGAVFLTVNPFSDNYEYVWSNNETTEDITGLTGGTYTVTVSDPSGCTATATFVVGSSVQMPSALATPTASTCGQSNGAVNLTVMPVGSYTYLWSNGFDTEDLSGVPAGNYSVTATSSSGCTVTATAVVQNNNTPVSVSGSSTAQTSCLPPNGSINITPSPAGAYTFIWSNGFDTEDISNLAAGNYSVTVSAGGVCTATATYTVANSTSPPSLGATTTASTCNQSNGAIDLNVNPAGAYSYLWAGGQNTEDLSDIPAGAYNVSVTASNGCTATLTTTVNNTNFSITITGTTTALSSCDSPDGSVDISILPAESYTYLWSNNETTEDISGLLAGNYAVTVSAGGSCTNTASFSVVNVITPVQLAAEVVDASCGVENGSVDLTVLPGGSYSFNWSNNAMTEDLINVAAGVYQVTVTGLNGCTSTISTNVNDIGSQIFLTATAQPNTSCAQGNGSIDLTVVTPGSFSYLWSNSATTEDLTGLAAGLYTVVATDANGCTSSASQTVSNDVPTISLSATAQPNTSCAQGNGSIDLTVVTPGSFSYLWSNSATTEDLTGLAAGLYTVVATDVNGCTSTSFATVTNSTPLPEITLEPSPASCGLPNGAIAAQVVSGVAPFVYQWSNGFSTDNINDLSPGMYELTVTAQNGCSTVGQATVSALGTAFSLNAVQNANTSCASPDGSIDITMSLPGNFVYQWSNSATTQDVGGLAAGSYSLVVTDDNGCSLEETFVITDNINPPIILSEVVPAGCDVPTGQILIGVISGGVPPILYSIDGGANFEDTPLFSDVQPGTYHLVVLDGNGCSSQVSVQVGAAVTPVLEPLPDITLQPGEVQEINVVIAPGYPLALLDTVIWTPSDGLLFEEDGIAGLFHPLVVGGGSEVYTVTVVGKNGCSTSANLRISVDSQKQIYAPNVILTEGELDNENAFFTLFTKPGSAKEIRILRIFDRWGNEVFARSHFEPNVWSLGWDGGFRGKPMNPAVFVWWAEIEWLDGTFSMHKGDVTLIK